jgi:hypothetical protein
MLIQPQLNSAAAGAFTLLTRCRWHLWWFFLCMTCCISATLVPHVAQLMWEVEGGTTAAAAAASRRRGCSPQEGIPGADPAAASTVELATGHIQQQPQPLQQCHCCDSTHRSGSDTQLCSHGDGSAGQSSRQADTLAAATSQPSHSSSQSTGAAAASPMWTSQDAGATT